MDSEELSILESRHRKEKKELQAQITALKKVAKNDKSKKKELTAEIARLESEQEIRHSREIEAVYKEQITSKQPSENIHGLECELTKVKISKAQKRRDKKSQQERERQVNIKLQVKENLSGPRNLENQAITARLQERNLKIYPIPSDGDCLYRAISHQLELLNQQNYSADELRKNVASYIRQNKDHFYSFMANPDTCEMLTDTEFEEYCDKIRDTKVWGGHLEITALSQFLKCPVCVIQATGPDCIEQGTEFGGTPLVITYHRHMYHLGEHYNSTIQNEKEHLNEES